MSRSVVVPAQLYDAMVAVVKAADHAGRSPRSEGHLVWCNTEMVQGLECDCGIDQLRDALSGLDTIGGLKALKEKADA